MAVSTNLPAQVLEANIWAVHNGVLNRKDPDKLDRSEMPWLAFLNSHKKEKAFLNGAIIQKLKRASGLTSEAVDRKSRLSFQTPYFDDEMMWTPYWRHMGIEIPHKDLMDKGFSVTPNGARTGKGWAKKLMSAKDADVLIDYVTELYEEVDDAWDVDMDRLFTLDGSQATGNPLGLDALLPLVNTAGTIGGKNRSDPLFRHTVVTGSTVTAGGTLERDIQVGVRAAQNNGRGKPGKIDYAFCGDDWLDAYVAYAKANGIEYKASVDSPHGVDIAIPDEGLRWNRIKLIRNPTFAKLDADGLYSGTPWAKRAYFLTSNSWEMCYQDLDKTFSVAVDASDLRITRMSWDGYYSLVCRAPNKQFVNTIA